MTTDSYVVSPLFFPGGNIGDLAINGTVNDLAMGGAIPHYLSTGFIIEEGFPLADLRRIVASMAQAARTAGVMIVTGDTKVVERGKGDGVFINTTGVGYVDAGVALSGDQARPGDKVVLSGSIGDHGVAVLGCQKNLGLDPGIASDTAALHGLVAEMLKAAPHLRCLRDPTRGGVAATLNELAQQSGVGIALQEEAIPINEPVAAACEILGIDPLYIANEGKLLAICPAEETETLIQVMRRHPLGAQAAVIGDVSADMPGIVRMVTTFGGTRAIDWLAGDPLPRIC